jgi:predicted metal-dependent enzyme (double-stranded beta helix superfamily)
MAYSINDYVQDLRHISRSSADEDDILRLVGPLAQRLAGDRSWLNQDLYRSNEGQGYLAHLLHEEKDHALAIFAVNWLPKRGSPPHDHGTWAVVVGVDGYERNVRYRRTDDGKISGHATLEVKNEFNAGPDDLVCMKTGGIHSVHNNTGHMSLSLHTYGRHVNFTNRRQYDLATNQTSEFIVDVG